jgi:hypothetical protein
MTAAKASDPAVVGCRLQCGVLAFVLVDAGGGKVGDGLAARRAVVAPGTTREDSDHDAVAAICS